MTSPIQYTNPIQYTKNLYRYHGADQTCFISSPSSLLSMYMIADGHSQKEKSAALAIRFSAYLKQQKSLFQQIKTSEFEIQEFINNLLLRFQESVKREWPRSAMSLMIVVVSVDFLHVFFLGDCRLGEIDGDKINWLTRPHTCILQRYPNMSEIELRIHPDNQCVFKQFLAKRSVTPEYQKHNISGKKYIICTDGFWKLSVKQQIRTLASEHCEYDDDIAYLMFAN